MTELRASQVAEKTRGELLQGSPSQVFSAFSFDSRQTVPGELFFALESQRDGHDYIPDAFKRGASGAVISREVQAPSGDFALIKVKDTLKALQELARSVLESFDVTVVGITGSNGKTTTKEFTSALLSQKFRVLKSEGNYNNFIGLPLTLLRLTKKDEVTILEMGMSATGEIRTLTSIAPPDIAVITNINPVHLEFFKSIDEIALVKREILEGAKEGATAVLNGDDPLVRKISRDWKGKKIHFGLSEGCEVCAANIQKNGFDGMEFELTCGGAKDTVHFPFFSESYLYDLLAALGVAHGLSLPFKLITPLIPKLRNFSMRGTLVRLGRNINLIDDSYNSNPKALESALSGLVSLPARRKIAVLADMLELGEREVEFHLRAGEQVARYGWDILVSVGPLSLHMVEGALRAGMKREQTFSFRSSEEAAESILPLLREGDFLLVKGSRGMKMEKVVEHLKKHVKGR